MKIAILGGAFNPPHLGHMLISHQLLEFGFTDQVWLTPCFEHAFQKELIDPQARLTMTNFLKNTNILVSDIEIQNKTDGQTINTMRLLTNNFPNHTFSFCMGSDNLKSFKLWDHWEELITTWDFLVFPRPGFDFDLKKFGFENPNYRFKLIQHPLLATTDISSTLIRKRLQANAAIDYLLPDKVRQFIHENKLYQ